MKTFIKLILSVLILVSINTVCCAEKLTGKVIKVIDGDTIKIETPDYVYSIRLACIDAPESKQEAGQYSKYFLTELIKDFLVDVDVHNTDLYGRKVGIVYKNGVDINAEMLLNGFAWHYRQYDRTDKKEYYSVCEEYARNKKIGLWSQENPVEPWIWRKNKK